MARRAVPGIRNIPAKEVRELMKLPWVRDEELSDRNWDMRLLPDGRLLWYLGDHTAGTLYDSRELFAKVKREAEEVAAKGPVDLTRTLLPPIEDFLRDAEAHAKRLGERIRVPEEALDRTEASLDAIYKAVLRLRRVKRMTPEVITPLVAYVGEVMRVICGGSWARSPTTKTESVPVYDSAETEARRAAYQAIKRNADAAMAEAKARGASAEAQAVAFHSAMGQAFAVSPKPIRYEVVEVPITGHENEPMIRARDGAYLQPFALVIGELTEHGTRGSLRGAVNGALAAYRPNRSVDGPGGGP